MSGDTIVPQHRRGRIVVVCGLLAMALASVVFILFALDSSGVVVVRNALLAQRADRAMFEWTPDNTPVDFKKAHSPVPKVFEPIVAQILRSSADDSNLSKSLAIASHLREHSGDGEGIHKDTVKAYWAIRNEHTGYCADFSQVFSGLAYAAQIPVREWSISWKEWGKGHAFSEIYEPRLKKWVLIDSFNSLYMVDAKSREPLGTLEVYDRLTSGHDPQIEVVPIVTMTSQFPSGGVAIDYYRAGIHELSLWWGSDAFGLNATRLMQTDSFLSRVIDPIMVFAARPNLKLLTTQQNIEDVRRLAVIRSLFFGAVAAMITGFVLVAVGVVMSFRRRRDSVSSQASTA